MTLTAKQKLFCYYYLKLGNIKEAAACASLSRINPLHEGVKILESKAGRTYLKRLSDEGVSPALVKGGFERLAFGSVNDAVRLAFAGEDIPDIRGLDLFNVSKIKCQKNGSVEIEFFDRQKALEALSELEASMQGGNSLQSFFDAFSKGSEAVLEDNHDGI